MPGRFRPPLLAMAAAMLVLIAVLATLQYRWLGRISDAERERLTATLSGRRRTATPRTSIVSWPRLHAFQLEPAIPGSPAPGAGSLLARLAERHDRWQATARYPKLIRELYVTARAADGSFTLQRFNRSAGLLEPVEWPASLTTIRGQLGESREEKTANGTLVVRTIAPAVWEQIPALVVPGAPTPLFLLNAPVTNTRVCRRARRCPTSCCCSIGSSSPARCCRRSQRITSATGDDPQYQLAVVEAGKSEVVHRSAAASPPPAAKVDASAELFQVRLQEFPQLVADVRRFTALVGPAASWSPAQALTTFRMLGPTRRPRAARRGKDQHGGGPSAGPAGSATAVAHRWTERRRPRPIDDDRDRQRTAGGDGGCS